MKAMNDKYRGHRGPGRPRVQSENTIRQTPSAPYDIKGLIDDIRRDILKYKELLKE